MTALFQAEPILRSEVVVADEAHPPVVLHQAAVDVRLVQREVSVKHDAQLQLKLRFLFEPLGLHELLIPSEMSRDFNQGIKIEGEQVLHVVELPDDVGLDVLQVHFLDRLGVDRHLNFVVVVVVAGWLPLHPVIIAFHAEYYL